MVRRIKGHAAPRPPSVESRKHGHDHQAGTLRLTGDGSSVIEDRKVHLAQTRRIGDCGDRGDLAMPDREIEDAE